MKQIILYIVILLVAAIVMRIITQATKRKNTQKGIHGKYTAAPLLSNHEKAGFKELLAYCTEHNLLVFTKVRLIDLVQPKKGISDYATYRNKVIQKHVDFVICDSEVNVKLIIELDDQTHDRPDRQARDNFVDAVLEEVGYKIIHSHTITPELLTANHTNKSANQFLDSPQIRHNINYAEFCSFCL